MSMYRSRNQRTRWRRKWPWKNLFPLRVDDRFCPECTLPFHEGPLPKEVASCLVDNVGALIFPAGGFRKDEYVVRVGRWRIGGKKFYCSEFVPVADIDSLLAVLELAKDKVAELNQAKVRRRSV